MKNSIIVILSILLLILSSYLCKSWFIQHQAVAEEEHQKQYKELSDKESKEDAVRMEEAFKNLDKTR